MTSNGTSFYMWACHMAKESACLAQLGLAADSAATLRDRTISCQRWAGLNQMLTVAVEEQRKHLG